MTEVALPDVALDVTVYNALPEVLLVSVLVRVAEALMMPVTVVVTVVLLVDVLLDVTVAEAELVALDVEPEDDPLPEVPPVPVLVPLLVADARALGVTDVVWLEVVDVLALVGTDVESQQTTRCRFRGGYTRCRCRRRRGRRRGRCTPGDAAGTRTSPTAGGRHART